MMARSRLGWLSAVWFVTLAAPAIALPTPVAQRSDHPAYLDQFYTFLNQQKFTKLLGSDRSTCDYSMDPTDVYEQGSNRFLTIKFSSGRFGTGCRGVLEFQVFQADCQTNQLYRFVRQTEGDPRFRGWERSEVSLYDETPRGFGEVTSQATAQICALPAKPMP